jgi:hypothetical protein
MTAITSVTYDISMSNGTPAVTRSLEFKNGDTISFSVTVPNGGNLSLVELHRASAQRVIELLQDWIKP